MYLYTCFYTSIFSLGFKIIFVDIYKLLFALCTNVVSDPRVSPSSCHSGSIIVLSTLYSLSSNEVKMIFFKCVVAVITPAIESVPCIGFHFVCITSNSGKKSMIHVQSARFNRRSSDILKLLPAMSNSNITALDGASLINRFKMMQFFIGHT